MILRWGRLFLVGMFLFGICCLSTLQTFARPGDPTAFCRETESHPGEIQGVAKTKPVVIGSVTKLFTTALAVQSLGADHRFKTRFQLSKTGPHSISMHIHGDGDPSMSAASLNQVFLELARLGIQEISSFSYDSHFFFLRFPNYWAHKAHPTSAQMGQELQAYLKSLAEGLSVTSMVDSSEYQLRFQIQRNLGRTLASPDVSPVPRIDSNSELILESVPLVQILQEMNRNSNNATSQKLFESIGGVPQMNAFLSQKLGYLVRDIYLLNGSGMPEWVKGTKVYNKASCQSVVALLRELDQDLKKQGVPGVESILSVAGAEVDGAPESIVSRVYGSFETEQLLAAKTGTVDLAVSLAGSLSTSSAGRIFFGLVYHLNSRKASKAWARNLIRQQINKILVQFGRGTEFGVHRPRFRHIERLVWIGGFS
ncbi:MAG: D-alanyl-D-alanine carboxypeptidase [Bdellovibrio sp.]